MKTLLAILLSFIVSEAPVLAIHGGYTLPGSTSLIGTYAGVLIPIAITLNRGNSNAGIGTNSLGLFTLSVPATGLGAGTVVIFSDGSTFTGSIQALANPDPSSAGILGVVNATYNYNLYVTVTTNGTTSVETEAITATAEGNFDAALVQDTESVGGLGLDLDGTSEVNISQGIVGAAGVPIITQEVTFAIEGFEQSATASSSSGT